MPEPPPPIKRNRTGPILLFAVGIFVAALFLIVALNIDSTPQENSGPELSERITELIAPAELNQSEVTDNLTDLRREAPELAATGGWIQVTDEGRLSQQYRFDRLDPNPEGHSSGWLRMTRPEMELYVSENQVVTLSGESALVYAPHNTLESGTMTGDVVIRMYEFAESQPFDPSQLTPELEVHTSDVEFDNFNGELSCDESVDVQTKSMQLTGSTLHIQFNEVEDRIELLRLHNVDRIRLMQTEPPVETSESLDGSQSDPVVQPRKKRRVRTEGDGKSQKQEYPTKSPQFYRLVLKDTVRIEQVSMENGWVANCDELHVVFSPEGTNKKQENNSDLKPRLKRGANLPHHVVPSPLYATIALMTVAMTNDDQSGLYKPGEDEIIITCVGGLDMVPLEMGESRPSSETDSEITMYGTPVQILQPNELAEMTCARVLYNTGDQIMNFQSSDEYPLSLESPTLQLRGEQFALKTHNLTGTFEGAGQLQTTRSVSQDEADDASVAVKWTDRLDLHFDRDSNAESNRISRIDHADFYGDVRVENEDIHLTADKLLVDLSNRAPESQIEMSSPDTTIEHIQAEGAVKVWQPNQNGSISANSLRVDFDSATANETVPRKFMAHGNVIATDPDGQTMWCDEMTAMLTSSDDTDRRSVDVEEMHARGNLEVVTADGIRVFADTLHADPENDTAEFTGENIAVISEQGVLENGKSLRVRDAGDNIDWSGSGTFRYFAHPFTSDRTSRFDRATLQDDDMTTQIDAKWNESMTFAFSENRSKGTLVLAGDVWAQSTPSPREVNTLTGQTAILQFDPQANEELHGESSNFKLKTFQAQGDAKLESRTWLTDEHSEKPRVFYLAGNHVFYDGESLEAHVDGAGELLIRDEFKSDDVTEQDSPLSAKGTALFRWSDELRTKRLAEHEFEIDMIGDVELRHLSLDEKVTTLTGDSLQAVVERTEAGTEREAAFDLGGAMELRRLLGRGSLYINAPTRDVECNEFEYDYATGIATMRANPGQLVTIVSQGEPQPLRAERITWNLIEDTLTATRVTGGTGQ